MNRRIWYVGVMALVLFLVVLPSLAAVSHGRNPWTCVGGGGMVFAAAAASPYSSYRTGRGAPIPMLSNGAVDINALISQMVDRGLWHYYYTLKLGAGVTLASQYVLFNAASGSPDPYPLTGTPVLTKVETNMPNTSTNGFNAPRDLILDQIGFHFSEDTRLADIVTFVKYSYFEFKIIDKVFFEGKLSYHPSGVGIFGSSTQTSESAWTLGIPDPHATNRFNNFSKYIAPQMNWSLILYFPPGSGPSAAAPVLTTANNGGTGLTLDTFIKGLTDRAVQYTRAVIFPKAGGGSGPAPPHLKIEGACMYLRYWPPLGEHSEVFPPEVLAMNRAQIEETQLSAARAALAARTVAPVSSFVQFGRNIANDVATAGRYLRTAGAGAAPGSLGPRPDAFAGAPTVVSLNPNNWSAPTRAEDSACGGGPYSGSPWSDAGMYRPALGPAPPRGAVQKWIERNPWAAVLLVAAGGLGLYRLTR